MHLQLQLEKSVIYHVMFTSILCVYIQGNFGEIGGFSSTSVELLFAPNEVGEYNQQFQIVFSHWSVNPVSQHVNHICKLRSTCLVTI